MTIINIAAYKFLPLSHLDEIKSTLAHTCSQLDLRGTILLANEGLNIMLAASRDEIDRFKEALNNTIPGLEDMVYKENAMDYIPYQRMLIKIKDETIGFGVEGIDPSEFTGPSIAPKILKEWLDENRDFTLLDTRNDYEVEFGTFDKAIDLNITHFKAFPEAVEQLDESLKNKPLVMFCTGGIRCEKASIYMLKKGFKEVYQLEGGILNYFKECGGDHYHDDCFVFDQREAINPDFVETGAKQCPSCHHRIEPVNKDRHRDCAV